MLEKKREKIHKDRRKHYVVLHEWNQANAQIQVEQDVDLVLKNMKLKILGQPHDEVLMTTDSRCKNYKANEDRIILKDGLLFRKYFGETRSVRNYQIRKYYQTPKAIS